MLTISKVFIILCLLCMSWGIGNTIPWVALSFKLSLTCGDNNNYYKNVDYLIPTLLVGIGDTQTISKTNQ